MTGAASDNLFTVSVSSGATPQAKEGMSRCRGNHQAGYGGDADQGVDDSELVCCTVTFEDVIEAPEPNVGQVVRFYEDDKGCIREVRA